MQIVIDMPQEVKKDIDGWKGQFITNGYDLIDAIKNGTVLPENIGRASMTLLDEYAYAKETDYVVKPISYALYQTWRIWDAKEKQRAESEDKE